MRVKFTLILKKNDSHLSRIEQIFFTEEISIDLGKDQCIFKIYFNCSLSWLKSSFNRNLIKIRYVPPQKQAPTVKERLVLLF